MDVGFEPIFEDEHILVVNKPPGIATQAPRQFDSLEARIRTYLARRAEEDRQPYLGIPHRLDRAVSGVMVFAKRKKAAQRLARQFENRVVEKTYHALVEGFPAEDDGTWIDYVRKIPDRPQAEVVADTHPDARQAILHFAVEERAPDHTRLRIQLETGRMHQIRVQCAARGMPVVGDVLYGSQTPFGPEPRHERERQIALHASRLAFMHPRTREPVEYHHPWTH